MQNITASRGILVNNGNNFCSAGGGYHHTPTNKNRWGGDGMPPKGIWSVRGYKETSEN